MRLDKPLKYEFLLNIKIYAYDKEGNKYRLILHTEENPEERTNQFLDYQDYVYEGEVIGSKIEKILKEDFGVKKILDKELLEIPNTKNKEDEDTDPFNYQLWIETDYNPIYAGKIGDIYVSWFEDNE